LAVVGCGYPLAEVIRIAVDERRVAHRRLVDDDDAADLVVSTSTWTGTR
jgi:hypothetical protein